MPNRHWYAANTAKEILEAFVWHSNEEPALIKEVKYAMPKQLKLDLPIPEGYEVKFVASITTKRGHRIYAKNYGFRAFPIVVKSAI